MRQVDLTNATCHGNTQFLRDSMSADFKWRISYGNRKLYLVQLNSGHFDAKRNQLASLLRPVDPTNATCYDNTQFLHDSMSADFKWRISYGNRKLYEVISNRGSLCCKEKPIGYSVEATEHALRLI